MSRIVKRVWFPVSLLLAVGAVFVLFGPLSGGSASGPRLSDMAPAGAGQGAFAAAEDASPTEVEIAKWYETVRQYPATVDGYVMLGNAYVQHVRETADPTDYGRADAAFSEALRQEPNNVDALIGRGVVALARHEFAEALRLGEQAVSLAPRTARAYGVLVDALTELGRYEEATERTQQMVDLRPDLASLSRVAYQRELRGDIDGAIEAMARAFDASVGAPSEQREYLRVLIGDLHLAKGEVETAEQIYTASLEVVPDFVWARAGMARVAAARGDLMVAVDQYRSATDAVPLPELLVALGESQSAAGLSSDAAGTFEVLRAMQQLYADSGVKVELELALFEANHGDPARAVELARDAYAGEPNIKAADALAWALYKSGDMDGAKESIDEALRLGTISAPLRFHAGMIALGAGDQVAARQHLGLALESRGMLSPLDVSQAEAAWQQLEGAAAGS